MNDAGRMVGAVQYTSTGVLTAFVAASRLLDAAHARRGRGAVLTPVTGE